MGRIGARSVRAAAVRAGCCGAIIALLAFAPPAATPADRAVIVGVNRDYPPYEYLDTHGRPAGFDVDLARAVADVEGIPIEFRSGVWDDLVGGFKSGRIDMLAGMLRSREREQFASFSTPHLVVHYSIFVRNDNRTVRSQDDLRGAAVLVERGSQMHEFLNSGSLGARPVPVASEPEALRQLAGGAGDAAVVPQLEGLVLARQRGLHVRQVGGPLLTRELCFALRKDEPELLSRFNTGLAVLYQTGRYATIYKRWFGEPLSESVLGRLVPWALGTLGLLAAALVAVGLWSWSLRTRVGIATHRLREANAEILEREEFLDSVIGNLPVGVFVKDARRGFAITLWNDACEQIFGVPRAEALGKTVAEIFPAENADAFMATDRASVERRAPVEERRHYVLSRSRGERMLHTRKIPLLDGRGEVTLVLGITEDVTEYESMQSAMRESQRLEGLGVLAGGIAHDFNNLLTAILGNLGLAAEELPEAHPARPRLQVVEITALRAADLTRQMLAYAGKAAFVVRPVDLNRTASEMADLFRVSVSPNATLRYALADGLPAIRADAAQVQQVILNLLTNASDAIGSSRGQIVIETERVEQSAAHPLPLHLASPPLAHGRYAALHVSDTGAGVPPETLPRIFDPFFTTKVAGHGLGLSAVLGILRAHGAGIGIESAPERGSRFSLYFPATDAPVADDAARLPAVPAAPRQGTVLLVEDAEGLRDTTARMLAHLGFDVLEAADGAAALETFARRRADILLVLTDLTMPGMNGLEVAKAIRAQAPDACVVLMSGFPGSGEEGGRPAAHLSGFLPKPFRLEDLREAIDQALADGRT